MTGETPQATYERRDTAGWITFNRPAKRNALSPTMVRDLHAALDLADRDEAVRSIVLTGAGTAFCAGADLTFFQPLLDVDDGCERFMTELLQPLVAFLARLRESGRPVIAAVNGPCAAGGLELVLCCDLVIASTAATFNDAHALRGLAPAIGGAANLVHAIGVFRAKRMLFSADTYDAETMAAVGLVTDVVEPAALHDHVSAVTATLARRSRRSLALLKTMAHRAQLPDWAEQVDADLADFRAGWGSADLREGIRAHAERRQPDF